MRQAGDRSLYRKRDALLDFERRITFGLRVDLHLDIGDVRYRIDRQSLIVPYAEGGGSQHQEQHHPAAGDGKA